VTGIPQGAQEGNHEEDVRKLAQARTAHLPPGSVLDIHDPQVVDQDYRIRYFHMAIDRLEDKRFVVASCAGFLRRRSRWAPSATR
jgi:hypothetical protein